MTATEVGFRSSLRMRNVFLSNRQRSAPGKADTTANLGGMAFDVSCQRYREFLETLAPQHLVRLPDLASPAIHYHDPFVDAQGLPAVRRVFTAMVEDVVDPRYTFTHCAGDGDTWFLRWHFTCRPKTIGRGHPWICDGITELRFDAAGLVVEHVEHWDSGEQVYEKIPVLRALIRWTRRRVSGFN
jgi:steroid Delta-isomerase